MLPIYPKLQLISKYFSSSSGSSDFKDIDSQTTTTPLATQLRSLTDALKRSRHSVRATISIDVDGIHMMERVRVAMTPATNSDEMEDKNADLEMAVLIQVSSIQ